MNKLEYNNAGGYPLTTNRLDDIQQAFASLLNGLGAMTGNLSIISGCQEKGSQITDGVVQIENEIFEFKAGIKQENVTLFEEKIAKEFENGEAKAVLNKRYISFGTGATSYKWADFKRVPVLNKLEDTFKTLLEQLTIRVATLEKKNAVFQTGGAMVFWNKPANEIPMGWREVTDWRGRIPIGLNPNDADFYPLGKTGGLKKKSLSIAEMPAHTHEGTSGDPIYSDGKAKYLSGYNKTGGYTGYTGGSQPFSIMNPYRVVYFIEFVG
ncbi:hypothetical protein ETU08_01705 [Apibacter muscae]|uniref:hypothetical protein n=1 Tax=Apibacter muscae TaxID=2509004 RepID=UPI0011AD4763|nr:hypothetical protein [Apibacter muscae]TWP31220.1 hypothetical protein ETU08_01705 [Apibacter muscae]